MEDTTFDDTFVMLCDWRGRCAWISAGSARLKIGEFIWEHLAGDSRERARIELGRVVALRESRQLEVVNEGGDRIRAWLWPLDSPDVAVCVLGIRVPQSLELLTQRERSCLELLGQGIETRQVAKELDVSISTIHTHMKRARQKLGLANVEALISFAARYCYPTNRPLHEAAP